MLSSIASNYETPTFPADIKEFGYKFDEKGELRHIETNEKFEFESIPGNQNYNQRRYEALGEIIGEYIEGELVEKYQFKKQIIPIKAIDDETIPKSRIYFSENIADCQVLLLLIQGGGVVRPGQWSRKVIINDSLQLGSMFPYIEKAKELNWGIIIFNPNEHVGSYKDGDEKKFDKIPGSESHQSHCVYVWENFVRNMTTKHILIVGHSYGGISINAMLDECKEEFKSRVCGIALTDSVHSSGMIPSHSKKWFKSHTINWIKSLSPTNEPVNGANQTFGCVCRSAGHEKHEYTSGTAIEPVFEHLKDLLHRKQKLQQEEGKKEKKEENKEAEEEKEEDKENKEQKNNLIDAKDDNKMEVEDENDVKEKGEGKEKKVTKKLENNEMEIDGKGINNNLDNNIDNNFDNNATSDNNNNNNNTNDNNNNTNDNGNNINNTNDSNTNDNNDNSNNPNESDTNDIAEKDEKGNIVDNQVVTTTTKVVDNGDITTNDNIDNNVSDNINNIMDNNANINADINDNNKGNDDFNNKSNDNNKDDMEIEEVKVSIDDDNNKVNYNKIEHTNIEKGDDVDDVDKNVIAEKVDDVNKNVIAENNKKVDDVDKNVIVENSKKIDDVDKNVDKIEVQN